jgi:hypothetical protein
MSEEQLPIPRSGKPVNLAILATILSVVMIISFGLCMAGGIRSLELMILSLVIDAVCGLGLLVVGIWALIRSARRPRN